MSIDIVRGSSKKPASSDVLVELFSSRQTALTGLLFIGYPIIRTSEGAHTLDALLISEEKGIVVFDLIEGTDMGDYCSRQDDSANRLESQLRTYSELMERRNLLIPIRTISFAPAIVSSILLDKENDYSAANSETLLEKLTSLKEWDNRDSNVYKRVVSVLQNVSTIRKSTVRRTTKRENSRGAKLKRLEDSIATLDQEQNRAVIETVKGVQRIRGLAGSGKTIILALKAAYLHIQHPEWRIAVTFNTRSLKGHFRRLIARFSLAQAHEEPDWENLRILNAWGAYGDEDRGGIYHEFCVTHDVEYLDFKSARERFGVGKEFSGACAYVLGEVKEFKNIYDVILVDEAQDLPPEFLRICYEFLDDKKMLVYAYDELQNLSGESLPTPEKIFGTNGKGVPLVQFDKAPKSTNDVILEKCYRNSRPVLTTAHALGFGIYRRAQQQGKSGLVQMFDHPQLWREIGYGEKGNFLLPGNHFLLAGNSVALYRTPDASPEFLENHSDIEDLIKFICFSRQQDQIEWLANEIRNNLENEELQYGDIIVINPNPLTTRTNVGPIRRQLLEMGIKSHVAGVDTHPDVFFKSEESITFTGIHRAKGNEAGMVYIVNAQECCSTMGLNLASVRNQLFTAITRSKAWVRVLGIGEEMEQLKKEYNQLLSRDFKLEFTYPTKEQLESLRIVHRDVSGEDVKRIEEGKESLFKLIGDIESGKMHLADLDEDAVTRLKELLKMNK